MGKRTSSTKTPTQPRLRKKQRTPLGALSRLVGIVLLVGAVLFVIGGFYYSGEVRDGALTPPASYDHDYPLEITDVSGDRVSITDSGSNDQIGQPGIEGIDWADGYAQTTELISSTDNGDGTHTDVRLLAEGATPPPVGTSVRLDAFAFAGDPEQAFGIPFETVRYTSDLDSFSAWEIPGNSSTWAIVVHGKGADLTESLRTIPILHDLGFPILVIHYRNDPGEASDPSGYHQFGVTEWVDVAAAVTYAEENGAKSHILVGYSMGGGVVTSYLTQSPLRNRARAAILDSPMLSFEAAVDHQASDTKLPLVGVGLPDSLTTFAKWIVSWRFDINWDASNYLAQTHELHVPMLIFHGSNDPSVPLQTSRDMAFIRPDITTLIETEASHVRSWNEGPDDYRSAILSFLADHPG